MFGGSYGSQHENALEKSLDDLLEEKTKEQIKHKNKDKDKKIPTDSDWSVSVEPSSHHGGLRPGAAGAGRQTVAVLV